MNKINQELEHNLHFASVDLRYSDLILSKELVYDPCDFKISELRFNQESSAYGACEFQLNTSKILFRVAKITPTKVGQFVTCWKRQKGAPIQPYDLEDELDLLIVSVRQNEQFGQFIFPKSILAQYGIISKNGKGGKRGIRVYPPWDIATNKQAQKSQKWQLEYFLTVTNTEGVASINFERAESLLAI